MSRLVFALSVFVTIMLALLVSPDGAPVVAQPRKGKTSAEEALAQVQLAEKGMKVEVWAAEPLMANPVSFCFDEKGRCFVAETTRFDKGVPDTRGHMYWLDEDLANRSIDDLLAMYRKHKYEGYEKYDDQVRLVWDSTGAGKADKSEVFAKGFNRPQDGLAAGLLARKGDVYLACIPDLYLLKDTQGANKSDVKKSLFTGFGPTVQYLGHDLHGLRMGPDGKLYFSMGDRGFNVKTKEGKELVYPNTGAVLRCDPDGGNLEVVHHGLRNPQEIAFDDFGNLFTYDNNSDSGDRARWVHIVEGGDSGWRGGFQYGTLYHTPDVPQGNRGPWNTEKLWHPRHDGQPAYIVPPLGNFGNGPAGITHYPGVGLNDKYKDHFFACDFTSNSGSSVIWAVSVKPKGASFELSKPEPFVKGMVPTDCEFGPDGAFYWSDWVGGWSPPGKGRIFRVTDPDAMKNPQVAEAKKLLAEGFEKKRLVELVKLLEFPHQLVRQEAQFELVARATGGVPGEALADVVRVLGVVVRDSKDRLARLHAVWGLGMLARKHLLARSPLLGVVKNEKADAEVKRAAVEQLGHVVRHAGQLELAPGAGEIQEAILKLFTDPDDRVKAAAAVAFGKVGYPPNQPNVDSYFKALFDLLRANNDKDPYLRHAAVMGLYYICRNSAHLHNVWKPLAAREKEKYDVPAVRLGLVLAIRKHKLGEPIAEFLSDPDPRVVAEAARALYDERLRGIDSLAKLADKPGLPDAVAFRAVAANFILADGRAESAQRIANFAARQTEPDYLRAFALKLLADWPKESRRDPITGLSLYNLPRDAKVAADALKPHGLAVFTGGDAVRKEAAQTTVKLGIKEFGPALIALVKDAKNPVNVRVDALLAVGELKDPGAKELADLALATDEPKLRAAGRTVKAQLDPAAVLKELPALLKNEKVSVAEKQSAFGILGGYRESAEVDKLLADWLDAVIAKKVPGELVFDVLDAADTRVTRDKTRERFTLHAPLEEKVNKYRDEQRFLAVLIPGDELAPYLESLEGGDAEKGKSIFLNNSAVYCQRCHKLDAQGGDVGPLLNGLAAEREKDRRYMLESLVLPNAKIAKGFETVILLLADDRTVSGIIKSEDKKQVKLVTAENKEIVVPVDDIVRRRSGPSAMPEDLHKKLTRRELRDLVEFLASLKEPPKK